MVARERNTLALLRAAVILEFARKGRYLPSERAVDVAVSSDNKEYWIATGKGVSRIELKEMSLSEKADYFESKMKYFTRENYIYVGYFNTS